MKKMKIISIAICCFMMLTIIPTITALDYGQGYQRFMSIHADENRISNTVSDNEYEGNIRVYITEIESRWNTNAGEPYHFGFLDFALDEGFFLQNEEDIYTNSIIWESKWAGYLDLDTDNVLVIASVFNAEKQQGYSDPPYGNPFDAYYVDATAGARTGETGSNTITDDFTHTVLIEEGTASWCGACPFAATALYNIFQSNEYPFYFVALIEDENTQARNRLVNDYDISGFPTMYFDGGNEVMLGASLNESIYRDFIESSGKREVYRLNLSVAVREIEKNTLEINLTISKNNEVINNPPEQPMINGPNSGITGQEQEYNVSATDPDGDDIYYIINWGDETDEISIGPYPSGEKITINHTWIEDGEYTIQIKAQDIHGEESEWTSVSISMPKYRIFCHPFFEFIFHLFSKFPLLSNAFP